MWRGRRGLLCGRAVGGPRDRVRRLGAGRAFCLVFPAIDVAVAAPRRASRPNLNRRAAPGRSPLPPAMRQQAGGGEWWSSSMTFAVRGVVDHIVYFLWAV